MNNADDMTLPGDREATMARRPRDYSNLLRLLLVIWLGLGLVVLALWGLAQIADILLVFIVGMLIAVSFAPFVRRLRSVVPKKVPDVVIVLVVYIVGLSLSVGAIGALAFPLIDQAQELASQLPQIATDASKALPSIEKWLQGFGINVNISELTSRFSSQIQDVSKAVLGGLASGVATATSAVAQGLLAVILSIYMLLSSNQMRAKLMARVPLSVRDDAADLMSRLGAIGSGFIRGQVILALSIGIPVGIFIQLMGLPYSVLLGLVSALAEFIPVVGSILGAVPAIIVGLVVGGPNVALILIVFFVILNQIEGNLIYPRVVGGELGIHPLVSIFALAVGYKYFGIWGAVLAVPGAAVLWALFVQAHKAWPTMMAHMEQPVRSESDEGDVTLVVFDDADAGPAADDPAPGNPSAEGATADEDADGVAADADGDSADGEPKGTS